MSREAKIFDKIKSSKSLPSLPQVLLKLIELCNREEATPGELAAVIRSDPAISAKVMQLVSSAHMGLLNKPGSLEQAVVYLGAGTVKNIALCAAVVQVFRRVKDGPGFNLARFWWHSLMCAATARRLAGCGTAVPPEEAFLAGLLHDIGKLLLWVHFRSDYGALLQAADSGGQGLLAGEARLGATHCAVGAWAIPWAMVHILERGSTSIPVQTGQHPAISMMNCNIDPSAEEMHCYTGSSYTFINVMEEPIRTWSIMPFSNTRDPDSPTYLTMSRLFAERELKLLPFTEQEVESLLVSVEFLVVPV